MGPYVCYTARMGYYWATTKRNLAMRFRICNECQMWDRDCGYHDDKCSKAWPV
jgi:hypothetical protein